MSGAVESEITEYTPPVFDQVLGHPKPLWMLFMAEFWERFAFYGALHRCAISRWYW